MNSLKKHNFINLLLAGPGPVGWKESVVLFLKGVCMGCADIIPGVSGGTIALISGIYQQLLQAIDSVVEAARTGWTKNLREGLAVLHFRFLAILLLGIGSAIISLARLMHYLLLNHGIATWAFFFGLICASILVIGKNLFQWGARGLLGFGFGAVGGYLLVGMIPVTTPDALWFIFLSGMIAICAMILPGISGSFFLLILGKYEFVTGALRNPFVMDNFLVLLVFGGGCVVGILSFSRLLNFMLGHHYQITMALLTGLMCGSMRKIWPWKEVVESVVIRGKVHVLRTSNIMPPDFGSEFQIACLLAVTGFVLVLFLERMAGEQGS